MNRLFDDAFTRQFLVSPGGESAWGSPAIDLYQTDYEVVVKAALPGIKTGEVRINRTSYNRNPCLPIVSPFELNRNILEL